MKTHRMITRFSPAPRLPLLLALAALPALLPGLLWLSLALAALLAGVALADLAASRRTIEAVRHVSSPLSLGEANPVGLSFRCLSAPVALEVLDDLPLHMEPPDRWPVVRLQEGAWVEAGYRVKPGRRGRYAIGPLHGRYRSPLGLWRRTITWPIVDEARVYPNLMAVRQYEVAIRQGRQMEGLKRARLRGAGTEFESLREYQDGDEFRAINWPASARRGGLVTNLYQVDRSQPIMLLIDAGRLMIPHIRGLSRLDYVLNAAMLLATVAAERGDQVGMMLFGGEVKAFVPPRKGRRQVMAMQESIYDVQPEQVEPDYGRMLAWFRTRHRKRSLVVLFTDLIDPEINRGLTAHLSSMAARHLVLVVTLTDPALLELSRCMPSDTQQAYEKATALEVLAQRAETRARLQRSGVLVIDVPPASFSTAVVNQYLQIKEQGRL